MKKLYVIDSLKGEDCEQFPLRLRKDLRKWIESKSEGSVNSVINFLIGEGVDSSNEELKKDDIFATINED